MTKKYEVVFDLKEWRTIRVRVEAENEEEAERTARRYYENPEFHQFVDFGFLEPEGDPDFVDCEEIEED